MVKNPTRVDKVSNILETTITTVETSKKEILEIVEHSRNEIESLKKELEEIKKKVSEIIIRVDSLEVEEKRARNILSVVSSNFEVHKERDIKEAYYEASNLRVKLISKKEEEKKLRIERDDKEIKLRDAIKSYEKVKGVGKSVSVATGYLKGNLDEIIFTIDNLDKKQYFGIKIIEAQEEERLKLSRDIHDGPAQSIASILVKSELCEKLIDIDEDKAKKELKNLRVIARDTLKDIRKIIYDLRPMSLDDLGLIPTLERYIFEFIENAGIDLELKVLGNVQKLEAAIEVAIFRIVQESLSNILKHSKADSGQVTIEYLSQKINVFIKDNGVGFNLDKENRESINKNYGFGLTSIRERIELLDGEFNVETELGEGTCLNMYIPLMEGD